MVIDGLVVVIQIVGMGWISKVNYVIDLEMYGMEFFLNWRILKDFIEYFICSMFLCGEMKVGEIYFVNVLVKELNILNSLVCEVMMFLVDCGFLENV